VKYLRGRLDVHGIVPSAEVADDLQLAALGHKLGHHNIKQ